MKLTVIHLEGSKQGLTETVNGNVITVGRDPSNTLSFDPFKDLDVSTRHASISVQAGQVMLQDLDSTNGTFLNGEKVTGTVALPAGCIVQFGENGPKLQMSWDLSEGPGKKTRMIHDLRSELDAAGLDAVEAKKAKARSLKIFLVLGFLGMIGFLIYLGVSHSRTQEALKAEATTLQKKADEKKGRAEAEKASETEAAQADWEKGLESLETASKAYEAENWEDARTAYREAADRFDSATSAASAAKLKALEAKLAKDLAKGASDASSARKANEAKDADRIKALEEEKRKERERLKRELLAELQGARDTHALVKQLDKLGNSKNPVQLKEGIKAIDAQLEKLKQAGMTEDSPEYKELLAKKKAFEASLEKVKGLTKESLTKIASKAKPKVVRLQTKVFALPAGQTLKTTKLRYPVAEGVGSGFFVGKQGLIVTAKEVVRPELFDPKALARMIKLKEKGIDSLHREHVVMLYDKAKKAYLPNPKLKVTIAREFPASKGKSQTVKIDFDRAKTEVEVTPHERDDNDVVILKLEGHKAEASFELATASIEGGLPCLVLGVQKDEAKTLKLFMFDGKAGKGGKVMELDISSFKNWLGGPVLDPDGNVVGVLIQHDDRLKGPFKSRAVAAEVFRETVK